MKSRIGVLMFASLFLSTVPVLGQLRERPDESLKGLKGIGVVVRYQGPAEESYGLTERQLLDAVMVRLKADDIRVVSPEELRKEPGTPYFCVYVVGTRIGTEKSPTFFYSFATDLIQEVTLARRQGLKTEGSTWNQDYALVVAKNDLRQVTLKISDAAHEFAQSVREANRQGTAGGH